MEKLDSFLKTLIKIVKGILLFYTGLTIGKMLGVDERKNLKKKTIIEKLSSYNDGYEDGYKDGVLDAQLKDVIRCE